MNAEMFLQSVKESIEDKRALKSGGSYQPSLGMMSIRQVLKRTN